MAIEQNKNVTIQDVAGSELSEWAKRMAAELGLLGPAEIAQAAQLARELDARITRQRAAESGSAAA